MHKSIEQIIKTRIMNHLAATQSLSNAQYESTPHRSCLTYFLVMEEVTKTMDSYEGTELICQNLAKAFD